MPDIGKQILESIEIAVMPTILPLIFFADSGILRVMGVWKGWLGLGIIMLIQILSGWLSISEKASR